MLRSLNQLLLLRIIKSTLSKGEKGRDCSGWICQRRAFLWHSDILKQAPRDNLPND